MILPVILSLSLLANAQPIFDSAHCSYYRHVHRVIYFHSSQDQCALKVDWVGKMQKQLITLRPRIKLFTCERDFCVDRSGNPIRAREALWKSFEQGKYPINRGLTQETIESVVR